MKLSPNTPIDLQLHTVYSDGKWTADALLDFLVAEGFGLAAITDHERLDTAENLQVLAAEKGFPLIVAAELSGLWKGELTDFLCYGFRLGDTPLNRLAQATTSRQHENSWQVFSNLRSEGYPFEDSELSAMLAKPAAEQINELLALVKKYHQGEKSVGRTLLDAGFAYQTNPPAVIVEAAHQSGALCILAHGGRSDGFVTYDEALLDELREEAPIDGIEAYYPLHSPEQTTLYLDYAARHNLLVSSGSDSHSPEKPPIKYRAELSRNLLERLGISFS
jgi:hypothetical protein